MTFEFHCLYAHLSGSKKNTIISHFEVFSFKMFSLVNFDTVDT